MSAISFTDHFHDSSDLISVTSTQVLSDDLTTKRHTALGERYFQTEPKLLHVSVDTALLLEDAVHSYKSTRYILPRRGGIIGEIDPARRFELQPLGRIRICPNPQALFG
jgi:hypothetical protein